MESAIDTVEQTDDKDFSYRAISELSDATEDVQAESVADTEIDEIGDY